jgi:phenol/toluene 2-monooxygenase (NADH) P1/A1
VQVDIKTTNIKPIRQTFSNVARRLGGDKPASRYQEATFDMQSDANFHYRPIWDPQYDIHDVRRTALVMADWYSFKDPRQYYYGAYTTTRAKQQEGMEKSLEFADKRDLFGKLSKDARQDITNVLLPLRHFEWGANMNNSYCTAFGFGAAITQATMFATMDRLGIAQYISRIGLLLDGNRGTSLDSAKEQWLNTPAWQGLRRIIENLFVCKDWFEVLIAQNLVLDGLIYPLIFREFEAAITERHGSSFAMITEFMQDWFNETSRWVDATVKTAIQESPENKATVARWYQHWLSESVPAVRHLATLANSMRGLQNWAFPRNNTTRQTRLKANYVEPESRIHCAANQRRHARHCRSHYGRQPARDAA